MIKSAAQLVQEMKDTIKEVSVEELAAHLANNIVLIDVRESEEFSSGHIPGSVNFPRGVLEMKLQMHPEFKDAESPLDEMNKLDMYVICRSGARSALATESLQKMGFTNVFSVAGGMMEWTEKGFHTK
ncbi:sulfurtransferase [Psychrosphaera saromensis]|uniref:rhodanese-like domain-containing protein n=1 Tax=Psychrosphaera saromensis TaxID=716813 RepID=UPI0019C934C0|nr:rhodanese-like domain-containing protein [Psychrosphaera saromensis]GHB61404.1 sulfurtransferase [Psychrosphaera saromensis]GLQ15279.1 sulfurtransferase [Psychrosphaera saromensis]